MLAAEFPTWFIRVIAFSWGAIWGSFFNVAIYRWPREMSVVRPPSHCPACGAPIVAWRNVPIFGYLFLRGRAACCGAKMTPRYMVVELLTAMLAVALGEALVVQAAPGTPMIHAALEALIYFAFVGGLIIATFVDIEWMEIPDEVSLPGAALGLATAGFRGFPGAEEAAIGAGIGFLLIQLIFVWGWEHVRGMRGMGEGDSKLMLMIGAFLGWEGVIFSLFAGALQGLLVAMVSMLSGAPMTPTRPDSPDEEAEDAPAEEEFRSSQPPSIGQRKLVFGPFLALGALEYLFFGQPMMDAYFALFR